jgi:hypothetical protein
VRHALFYTAPPCTAIGCQKVNIVNILASETRDKKRFKISPRPAAKPLRA